jgi:protoporphyrinogen oxidase
LPIAITITDQYKIGEVLGIKRDQFVYVIEKENLLPSPVVGHERLINAIDNLIADRRLLLTGNYFYGLSIEDCVSRSLREFKRLKNNSVAKDSPSISIRFWEEQGLKSVFNPF